MTCGCITANIAKDGIEFRQERVTGIDPAARRVSTDAGSHDADFLVVAMGADYDMAAEELPEPLVTGIDPATRTAKLANGETLPYDLFVGIPVHRAPDPLAASGLAVNGWVPVDQTNLRTSFPHVYALGDVCTGPRTVPTAGIFAESAALVVADDIAAAISGEELPAPFAASGVCYAEFGEGLVSKVEVSFLSGAAPAAQRYEPSREYAAEKEEFGATRRARWFGL